MQVVLCLLFEKYVLYQQCVCGELLPIKTSIYRPEVMVGWGGEGEGEGEGEGC